MRIQHNIMALNSNRQLGVNNSAVARSLEKLSSGYRINRAGDDAAGLAISEKMRAQIKGLEAATDNSQDAISLVQTAEGGLQEVHSMLNRMTELATKSANGTYTDNVDRQALQDEISALKDEINRIADGTDFNGIKLLDGTMSAGVTGAIGKTGTTAVTADTTVKFEAPEGYTLKISTGANGTGANPTIAAAWSDKTLTITLSGKTGGGGVWTQADIDEAIKNATNAPSDASKVKVEIGGDLTWKTASTADFVNIKSEVAKQSSVTSDGITVTATKAGSTYDNKSLTFDTGDVSYTYDGTDAALTLKADKSYSAADINQILKDTGVEMNVAFEGTLTGAQLKAKSDAVPTDSKFVLAGGKGVDAGGGLTLQIGDTNDAYNQLELSIGDMHVNALDLSSVDISTRDGASAAMAKIKTAINTVSTSRGKLGAIQNRLEHTINNLGVTTENITSAESRIRDVDMAKEMMNYTKNSVLVQSAQAMLAQANQQPQSVLQLLQ
ncbi:flagellin [Hungatella hathewayi]|uniref:flagellin N-terminal helical domain-containing protein n=1 Tax=Hungatella hathewayi TaxID=154046 RepID=UPI00210C5759|nr:flagellin [Hungatella hathewayi]MCQ5384627.1 flagellin [Hungatella hathewayi]